MELQEIKNLWNMDQTNLPVELSKKLLKQTTTQKVQSMLWQSKFEAYVEIVANALFLLWSGGYIANNIDNLLFLAPAILLHIIMILGIVYNVYRLYTIYSINYTSPIIESQKKIETLKLLDRYERNSLYALIPVVGTCFILMLARILHLESLLNLPLMASFIGGSVVISFVVVQFINWTTSDVEKARQFLNEIRDLEQF